jgi:flagellar M-ring protein FliF
LVSGAIGLQPERGDQLVVESLPFESTLHTAPPPPQTPVTNPTLVWQNIDWRIAAGVGGGVVVIGFVLFMVARKRRRKAKAKAKAAVTTPLPAAAAALKALSEQPEAAPALRLDAEPDEVRIPQGARKDRLVRQVKAAITEDPALVAGVLRTWLEER